MVTTFAGSGEGVFADGAGTYASFKAAYGLTVDPYGIVIVADTGYNRIRMISPAGKCVMKFSHSVMLIALL